MADMSVLQLARATIKSLKGSGPPEDSIPDVIADLQAAEKELRAYRQSLLAEAPGPLEGQHWKLATTRKAKRSYNESKLLVDLAHADESLGQTLRWLLDEGVVRLSWSWRNLQRYANQRNVTLVTAYHEIGDGDEAHIGEVWEEGLEPKPID